MIQEVSGNVPSPARFTMPLNSLLGSCIVAGCAADLYVAAHRHQRSGPQNGSTTISPANLTRRACLRVGTMYRPIHPSGNSIEKALRRLRADERPIAMRVVFQPLLRRRRRGGRAASALSLFSSFSCSQAEGSDVLGQMLEGLQDVADILDRV